MGAEQPQLEKTLPNNDPATGHLSRLQADGIPQVGQRPDILLARTDPASNLNELGTKIDINTTSIGTSGGDAKVPEPPKANLPADVSAADDKNQATLTKDASGKFIKTVDHTKHGFKLDFGRDAEGKLTKITSSFKGTIGTPKPDQVYTKKGNDWFYKTPDGKEQRMQGDLKVDDGGHFTQMLRRDMDGDGKAQETTRTMDTDGTDTINRMDGTKSIFKYDETGKMKEWIEKDSAGIERSFSPTTDPENKGRLAFKSATGEIRYNPKVEDNGNVTYKKAEDLDKKTNQVVTSSGDRITNGENGVKYAFNDRGDVSSIQFPHPRLFEGHRVSQIDIGYRDNQGQAIDKLTLYNDKGYPSTLLQRAKDTKGNPANSWNVFEAQQGKYHHTKNAIGDFAIKDGLMRTTEPLIMGKEKMDKKVLEKALEQHIANNDNLKAVVDAYKGLHQGQIPENIVLTYTNSAETSKTNKPNKDEYSAQVFESNNPNDKLDYLVPGEALYKLPTLSPIRLAPRSAGKAASVSL